MNSIEHRYELFIKALGEFGVVAKACEIAGLDRSNAYQRRLKNPEFAAAWEAAIEDLADRLEAEAFRRAVVGTEKGVWHQGVQVGTETQYSDSLLALALKARRPSLYRDNSRVELGNVPGESFKTDSPTETARRVAFLLAKGVRAAAEAPPDDGEDLS